MGCRGRAFGDCAKLIIGYLGEEPQAGKGRDRGGWGGKILGKQRDEGLKGGSRM